MFRLTEAGIDLEGAQQVLSGLPVTSKQRGREANRGLMHRFAISVAGHIWERRTATVNGLAANIPGLDVLASSRPLSAPL